MIGDTCPGPQAAHGNRISSRNSLKHGFFSKDLVTTHRLDQDSKKRYLHLLNGLLADWRPVGTSEVLQIELMAFHLLQYRRFIRYQHSLILTETTPGPDSYITDEQLETWARGGREPKVSANRKPKDAIAVWEATLAQIKEWKNELPNARYLGDLERYESHLLRLYYRAIAELERLQRMRLGEKIPPRLIVEVHND